MNRRMRMKHAKGDARYNRRWTIWVEDLYSIDPWKKNTYGVEKPRKRSILNVITKKTRTK